MPRYRRRRRSFSEDEDINLTPLLDVIFNLLFFFVLATNIKTVEAFFDISLPQASQGQVTDSRQVLPVITVSRDGALTLNGQQVEPDALTERLRELLATLEVKTVVVSADAEATVQQSVDAMDLVRAAGVMDVIQRVENRPIR